MVARGLGRARGGHRRASGAAEPRADAAPPRHPGLRAGARRGQGDPGAPARLPRVQRRLRRRPDGGPPAAVRGGAGRGAASSCSRSNNILSPAHGRPLATPTQDMVLGGYYLTYSRARPDEDDGREARSRGRSASRSRRRSSSRSRRSRSGSSSRSSTAAHGELHPDHARPRDLQRRGRALAARGVRRRRRASSAPEFINRTLSKREMDDFISRARRPLRRARDRRRARQDQDARLQATRPQAGITISKNDIVIPPDKEEILAALRGAGRSRSRSSTSAASSPRRSATSRSSTSGRRRPTRSPTRWRRRSTS